MKNPAELQSHLNLRRTAIRRFRNAVVSPTKHCNVEADMTAASAFRKNHNRLHPESKITFNDIIIKAAANALPSFPLYTCSYPGGFRLFPSEEISIRFPVDIGQTYLATGLVKNADKKSLAQIGQDAKESVEQSKQAIAQSITRWSKVADLVPILPEALGLLGKTVRLSSFALPGLQRKLVELRWRQRGTFMITNVGPTGIRQMEGPITSPDILHLMVAAAYQSPYIRGGKTHTRPLMPLIAKFDCRITDEAPASEFLQAVRANLENPETELGPY